MKLGVFLLLEQAEMFLFNRTTYVLYVWFFAKLNFFVISTKAEKTENLLKSFQQVSESNTIITFWRLNVLRRLNDTFMRIICKGIELGEYKVSSVSF